MECANGNQKNSRKSKYVSNIMMEKHNLSISPRQCEYKFNGLNKIYKRLNDVLGRAKSDELVKNPHLLNSMDLLPQDNGDLWKILCSSCPLYYEEIHDYHMRLHAIATDLGMVSSKTKSREGSMNDQNGGNDEHGEGLGI